MKDETVGIITFLLIMCLLLFFMVVLVHNYSQEEDCIYYADQYDVIFDKSRLFNKCLFIEDGEELTKTQYYNKHKYDGLEVRR